MKKPGYDDGSGFQGTGPSNKETKPKNKSKMWLYIVAAAALIGLVIVLV